MRTLTLSGAMHYLNSIYHITSEDEILADYAVKMLGDFYISDVKLKDGVEEFLRSCKEKGIKMCIASASNMEFIKLVADNLKISSFFSGIFSCEEIGKGKEEPDIYLAALKFLETDKEETCVFEDSLTAIKTAKGIGLKTVVIYDKYNYGQEEMRKIADEYIDDGETLLKLL